jgi:hypothetical protein
MRELEKLLAKKFNAEIRGLQLKHRQEIENLKIRQFDLMQNVFTVCSGEPKIENEFIKILKD